MSMRHRSVILGALPFLLLTGMALALPSDDSLDQVIAELVERGYENVGGRVADNAVTVWCENRSIRFTTVWIVEALTVVAQSVSSETNVEVVALKEARPIAAFSAKAGDVNDWIQHRISTSMFRDRLNAEYAGSRDVAQRANASMRKVDLKFGPGTMKSMFGVPHGVWIRAQFDVSTEVSTTLAPGIVGHGQYYFPVFMYHGPVGSGDKGSSRYYEMRPGSMLLAYFRPVSESAFVSVTTGVFEFGSTRFDGYGAIVTSRHYSPDGRWALGLDLGYIVPGAYYVSNDVVSRYRQWLIVWPPSWKNTGRVHIARIEYRFSSVDLRIVGRWGRFFAGDRGWRLDIERKFGELGLTIFGLKSDGRFQNAEEFRENDSRLLGGVRFEFPIPPRRRSKPSALRTTTNTSFRWSYRYRAGNIGLGMPTGYAVDDLINEYSPVTVLNNLDRARAQIVTE